MIFVIQTMKGVSLARMSTLLMENILQQYGKYPRVRYIPGGARFHPSTV